MLAWVFTAIVVASSIIVCFIIFAFTGLCVYPAWLIELQIAFFWFSGVFRYVKHKILMEADKNYDQWDLKPFVGYLFVAHIMFTFFLRFVFRENVYIAYLGTFIVGVVLPASVAFALYPRWLKRQETTKFKPGDIKEMAMKSALALQFMACFPEAKIYVSGHARKHEVGFCLFLYRRKREERPALWEDVLLEVAVDLKRKTALAGREQAQRYIFETVEELSAVFSLPPEAVWDEQELAKPLEEDILKRFDTLLARFPTLSQAPLPVVSRNLPYEIA